MDTPPKVIGIAPQLVVPDVEKAAAYYRDVLGFAIMDYFPDPPVYAMVERDGFQIHFGKANETPAPGNAAFSKISTCFILWIPEIDRLYKEVKSRGAAIVQEIVHRTWGSREFIICYCNGFTFTIAD